MKELMHPFFLASASPRRLVLLQQVGLNPIVEAPQDVDEKNRVWNDSEEMVKELSFEKAKSIFDLKKKPSIVLGADTVVVLKDEILGKPDSPSDAKAMLEKLSGEEHRVLTGVSLFCGERIFQEVVITSVKFRPLKEDEVLSYIHSNEPLDKAGAYGIQGFGSIFVEEIKGCYFNVVGLPLARLWKMLDKAGAFR